MDKKLNLQELREKINNIDKELVGLLEQRFQCVMEIGMYKKENLIPVLDSKRELEVIEKSKKLLNNPQYDKYLEKLYTEIMKTCRQLQKDNVLDK